MALLFMDGFDHYLLADASMKYNTATLAAGSAMSTTAGRRSGGCVVFGGGAVFGKNLNTNASTLVAGAAFSFDNFSDSRKILSFFDGATEQMTLRQNTTTGTLSVYRGATLLATSTLSLGASAYNYIEFLCTFHGSTGVYTVKVNGATWITGTGANTISSANAYANWAYIGNVSSTVGGMYADDYYVCDGTGSTNNTFLGDVRIDTLYPDGDGNYSQFTTSSGSTHYTLVDEATPNTSDYVYDGTTGHKDSYTFANLPSLTGTVFGVQASASLYKDDAGSISARLLARSSTTNVTGATRALNNTPTYYSTVFETDPNGAITWTQSSVNAAEFGVEVQ
jgi:hypothetical protein